MAEKRGGGEQKKGQERKEESDLGEREYKDEQGNVHHHTRTSRAYQEQKGGEGGKSEKQEGGKGGEEEKEE